jgi:uncharacterized NAD(P)/FAD-binding protein YdhS
VNTRHYQVAIIGAGFCGTMVAANLARLVPGMPVALIERTATLGAGMAYGTSDIGHLLNVRTGRMGAFADDPSHFLHWLETQPEGTEYGEQAFAPRLIYGRYLKDILGQACAQAPGLNVLQGTISAIRRLPQGGFELIEKAGEIITAESVVLALGNFPPDQSGEPNPYAPETWRELAQEGDVLIVGTGLTCLDLVVTLAKTKKTGVVHLLSRHGLLPREHTASHPYELTLRPPYPTTAVGLLQAVRGEIEIAHVPWQSVIDALRPLSQKLWQSMSLDEQRRCMRHLRSYWDVHRHRSAPQVMDFYRVLEKQGRILLHKGSLVERTIEAEAMQANGMQAQVWRVRWRPRGQMTIETFTVRQIVHATGPQEDFCKLDDLLVKNLLRDALIAADDLHMGILTTSDYRVCDCNGKTVPGLYALGRLLKGKFYESVAVPELRDQAAAIACLLAR